MQPRGLEIGPGRKRDLLEILKGIDSHIAKSLRVEWALAGLFQRRLQRREIYRADIYGAIPVCGAIHFNQEACITWYTVVKSRFEWIDDRAGHRVTPPAPERRSFSRAP